MEPITNAGLFSSVSTDATREIASLPKCFCQTKSRR